MNLKVAITGSSGLVGTALIAMLRERNAQLFLLRRPDSRSTGQTDPSRSKTLSAQLSSKTSITEVRWDPASGVEDGARLEGLDAFINLAGRSIGTRRWTASEKNRLRESRVLATNRLVQQLCQLTAKPKLFLSASATGIYGNCGDQWVTESSARSHDFLGDLAYDWEQASQPLVEQGVRVVHARLGMVLAVSGGALAKMLPIFRWGVGGVLGNGGQYWSWIGLEDCCRALLHLLDREDSVGPFNLVSPEPVTNRQFTKILGKTLQRPTVLPAPAFALRLAMGEMADALLLASCRTGPERLQQSGFSFNDPNLESFLKKIL
jgi:uncharacterized protein